jgi:hypothetical protein
MPDDEARDHARKFVEAFSSVSIAEDLKPAFLEVAEAVVDMPNRDQDSGVENLKTAVQWAQQAVQEFSAQFVEQYGAEPHPVLNAELNGSGPEGAGLAISLAYLRVADALKEADQRRQLIDEIRDPAALTGTLQDGLNKVESDFASYLAIEAGKELRENQAFIERVESAQKDLLEMQPRLEDLARRDDIHAENVFLVIGCSLAFWWCVVAAVVIIVGFGIVVLTRHK